ncbi:MAG TPA: TetR family transcriptional regulator [Marmoricola sp.]|jgi:AcrR family transcriptional regulator|nr:TetR family transcriptional regulator [Marmoricola sp.]
MRLAIADLAAPERPSEPSSGSSTESTGGTRDRLLQAAAAVLSRRGYTEARLGEIAAAANLKAPAIYYHFAGRDALITAALREGQILVRLHVLDALAELPDTAGPIDRILLAVDAHLRVELELSDFASAVVRTAGHVPPQIRADIEGEIEAYHDVWRDLLAEAGRSGCLRPGLDASVARMLVLGALNWSVEWRTPATPVDDVIVAATDIVRGALFLA